MLELLKRQDRLLTLSVFLLVILGLATIHSVGEQFFMPQVIGFLISVTAAIFLTLIDFRPLITYRWFTVGVYALAIFLLILTFFVAPEIREARSWLVLGSLQFQTSEFAKAALIIVLAYFFARAHVGIARLTNITKSFVLFVIPGVFIFFQPDLGTTLILFLIWIGFLFISGIPWRHILVGLLLLTILGVIGWHTLLADYQKERIIGFVNPTLDPLGVNYSVIQSKIAVGSAGFFGKGYGQGTQSRLGFLPESHSDFIFSAFIEEWGLIGGVVLISIFTLLLLRVVIIGFRSQNNFFKLFALGVGIMFLAQFVLNTGSALGFLPVTGITFPFFSYGGSSLLINMALVGIIQSIAIRSSFLRTGS